MAITSGTASRATCWTSRLTNFAERSEGNFTYYGNQQAFYFFGNDDWKVRPNLTINLGLRYELTTVPLAQNVQAENAIASVPGLVTFAAPKKQTTNFLPRVGFSWNPNGDGNTVIRGGFSMAVDVLYDNLGILSMPPEVQQTCDVGQVPNAACFWSDTAFLAKRRLAVTATPSFHQPSRCPRPDCSLHTQSVAAVLGNLDSWCTTPVCREVRPRCAVRGNQGHPSAGPDPTESRDQDQRHRIPADLREQSLARRCWIR